jgi:hypothetical protein
MADNARQARDQCRFTRDTFNASFRARRRRTAEDPSAVEADSPPPFTQPHQRALSSRPASSTASWWAYLVKSAPPYWAQPVSAGV